MIIKRQKDFSSKLKLGTRLQVKAIEKADKKEKERRKEFKKNIESYDEDFADKGFYQDALKLRSGKMTEDEFIAKHPWTAKKKLFSNAATKVANKAIRKKLGYAKESPLKSRIQLNRKDPYFGGGFNRGSKNVDLIDDINMELRGRSLHDKINLKGNTETLWGRKDSEGLLKVGGKRVKGGLNKDAKGLEAVRDLASRPVRRK